MPGFGLLAAATALSGCPTPSAVPAPPPNRPSYSLTISIAGSKKVVTGTSRVTFALDRATDRIVFRLWPNMPAEREVGARLDVQDVLVDGAAVSSTSPDPTTLILEKGLASGESATVSMAWTLQLPRTPTERLASRFGVRLSSFFPLLAWSGTDWALDPPAPQLETWTSPTSDFDVRIHTPKGMQVVASGARVGKGHWRTTATRDFAMEAGRVKVVRRTVHVPAPVRVTVAGREAAFLLRPVLDAASHALRIYSERYGAYPWRTYTVVIETDRPHLGEEYPTLVYVSSDSPSAVVDHETAHQWFYSLVGDDQARDPWLDESLAQWATARITNDVTVEATLATPAEVANRLGDPMTFWGPLAFMPTVWDGLYLQGVKALASFQDNASVDCALRRYVHENAYRTAVPRDFLAAFQPTFPQAEAVLTGFGVHF